MDAQMQQAKVRDVLPWVKLTFDYTDQLAELIPDDKLGWRPEDPSGKWCFSLGEIAMHCADARRMLARQLNGEETEEGYFSSEPGEDGVWNFKNAITKQQILDGLKVCRDELEPWLEKPANELLEVTDGTRAVFQKSLDWMKEHGKPVEEAERRGPANIMRVLMAAAVHEAGHRGSLQTLLRQHGVNLPSGE